MHRLWILYRSRCNERADRDCVRKTKIDGGGRQTCKPDVEKGVFDRRCRVWPTEHERLLVSRWVFGQAVENWSLTRFLFVYSTQLLDLFSNHFQSLNSSSYAEISFINSP